MTISFGDDAFDAYVAAVSRIPTGWTVALLRADQAIPLGSGLLPGTDVRFVSADHDGVTYQLLDREGEIRGYGTHVRSWQLINQVHVY